MRLTKPQSRTWHIVVYNRYHNRLSQRKALTFKLLQLANWQRPNFMIIHAMILRPIFVTA